MPRRSQADRSNATRQALIDAALPLFAEKGFAGVTLDEIADSAGVTRGALYHHYADKAALFRAVFEACAEGFRVALVEMLKPKRSPSTRLRGLMDAYLDACLDPTVRRIALLDGPAVLGFEQWRALERKYFLELLIEQLAAAARVGKTSAGPDVLAPIFFAAAMESGLLIAESDDPVATRRKARVALRRMLESAVPMDR